MTLPVPKLDDKNWSELVDEARSLIPRHARHWTDHNVHDPGITFIELFAWLAEIMNYRLDQETEQISRRFLKLVGFTPKEIKPAHVEVLFDMSRASSGLRLPAFTHILPIGNEATFPHQTIGERHLTKNILKKVFTQAGSRRVDQTAANEKPGIHFAAFGEDALPGAWFELAFGGPFAEPQFHLAFRLFFEEDLGEPSAHAGEEVLAAPFPGLRWEYRDGQGWRSLKTLEDTTRGLTRSGTVVFATPAAPAGGPFLVRGRLADGRYEIPPRLLSVRLNAVTALQRTTIVNEVLESGSGVPDHIVTLKHAPLLDPADLVLESRRAGSLDWKPWQRVEDFAESGPGDRHFMLDAESGEILFGNGLNGKVPEASEKLRASRYSHSRGAEGGLSPGLPWRIDLRGAAGIVGVNPRASEPGRDAQTIDEAKLEARHDFQSERFRAVTAADHEELALTTPGLRVARAKAIAGRRPDLPALEAPDSVTVVVVPRTRSGNRNPSPSPEFLDAVQQHLDSHRLIGGQVHVVAPGYVAVSVVCSLRLKKRSGPEPVRKRALEALDRFLDPVRGGPAGTGWPFGRPVFPSEIHQLLDGVEGVDYVSGVVLRGEGDRLCQSTKWSRGHGRIELPETGLVHPGSHRIELLRHGAHETGRDATSSDSQVCPDDSNHGGCRR